MATLKTTIRTELGSRNNRKLRKKGIIPGILYGHGEKAIALSFEQHEVELAILHGERLQELDVDGKKVNALIKEVQYDTFGNEILHIDMTRVDLDERVELTVPVILIGTPEGLKDGGVLQQTANDITLSVSVSNIPEELKVIVTTMQLNDHLYLKDIELPEGAELVGNPDDQLCSVTELAEEVEPEEIDGEASLEPEVIGEKKADEESEEE